MPDNESILQIRQLCTGYHKKAVLEDVSLHLAPGERVAVVGRNGAGKTTLLQTLLGVQPVWRGHIDYLGKDITHASAQERVRNGMCLVPQGGRIFSNLTALENLEMGAYLVSDASAVRSALELVYGTFPILQERKAQLAGTMSGGERQMLAIGRALMASPRLLMLDEPSLGLAPVIVQEMMQKIEQLSKQFGTTVLVIEQNVQAAFRIVERVYVLKLGQIVLEQRPQVLLSDDRLRKAYLS